MNHLKTLVVLTVLGVVGYGLYLSLGGQMEPQEPLPDYLTAEDGHSMDSPPTVHLGPDTNPHAHHGENGHQDAHHEGQGHVDNDSSSTAAVGTGTEANVPYGSNNTASLPPAPSVYSSKAPYSPNAAHNSNTQSHESQTAGPPDAYASPKHGAASSDPLAADPNDSAAMNQIAGGPVYKSGATAALPSDPAPALGQDAAKGVPGLPRQSANSFDADMENVRNQIGKNELSSALLSLSLLHGNFKNMSDVNRVDAQRLLDQIAGKVIYSREHLLDSPYVVQQGDTLESIIEKRKLHVPPGLLAKINGLGAKDVLAPGTELKVVRGPFNAIVSQQEQKLTLWLGARYAGEFQITLSPGSETQTGTFYVLSKTREHVQHDGHGWLGLHTDPNSSVSAVALPASIVGMDNPAAAVQSSNKGLIAVTSKDADDLFDILSQGARVTIRR